MLSPAESIAEIERFAGREDSQRMEKPVLSWNPGTYTYLFTATGPAVTFVANRIRGSSLARRVGSTAMRFGALYPPGLGFAPAISRHTVSVSPNCDFDVAVAGYRLKLLDFTAESVLTLPIDRSNSQRTNLLRTEITLRDRLPASIPSPVVFETDREYPYIREELVEGRELSDPVGDWQTTVRALRSLRALYLQQPTTFLPMETVLSDVDAAIEQRSVSDHPTISAGASYLRESPLPSRLRWCRIHGDFHAGNILVDGDDFHILDWEDTSVGYPTADFLHLFEMQYRENGDPTPLLEILSGEGLGSQIANAYATELGETVYDDDQFYPGLIVLALLGRILRQDDPTSGVPVTLLDRLLDSVP